MRTRPLALAAAALAATLAFASAAAGDHDRHRGREHEHDRGDGSHGAGRGGLPPDPAYAKECGSCHLAYPPRLLPAASWRKILAGLDRHFGQDAELEPEARDALERWIVAAAGRDGGEAPLRITDLRWFRREHREVPGGAAARPSIGTMANCAACHPGAESWDFDEDRVRIPR
jgi:hypothetical protein